MLVSRSQLDFIKAKVAANAEPWRSAYAQLTANSFASLSRTPKPHTTVECGSYSNPDNGCTDERQDALAAYTDALAWCITGNSAYAQESVKLMDAWSATIKYSSWPNEARFATMLRTVYLPEVKNGSNSNDNWELSMMEAAVGISVFLDDRADYNASIARYLNRVQAYIYEPADGALPKTVPGQGLNSWVPRCRPGSAAASSPWAWARSPRSATTPSTTDSATR